MAKKRKKTLVMAIQPNTYAQNLEMILPGQVYESERLKVELENLEDMQATLRIDSYESRYDKCTFDHLYIMAYEYDPGLFQNVIKRGYPVADQFNRDDLIAVIERNMSDSRLARYAEVYNRKNRRRWMDETGGEDFPSVLYQPPPEPKRKRQTKQDNEGA